MNFHLLSSDVLRIVELAGGWDCRHTTHWHYESWATEGRISVLVQSRVEEPDIVRCANVAYSDRIDDSCESLNLFPAKSRPRSTFAETNLRRYRYTAYARLAYKSRIRNDSTNWQPNGGKKTMKIVDDDRRPPLPSRFSMSPSTPFDIFRPT